MTLSNQHLSSIHSLFLTGQVGQSLDEIGQAPLGIDGASTSRSSSTVPLEKAHARQQVVGSSDFRSNSGAGQIHQPAMRIEIRGLNAPSTETGDSYYRLRPWQERCLNMLLHSHNSIINAPMASGKTLAIAAIAAERLKRNGNLRIVISVPQKAIAAGFRSCRIEMPDGARVDWEVQPQLDLCSENTTKSTLRLLKFLSGAASESLMGRIALCTHATLVRAFAKSAAAFDNVLIVIDEAHHVKYPGDADPDPQLCNQMGTIVRHGLAQPDRIQLLLATATFFRGDKTPIIPSTAEFNRFDLSYEEYFENCRFLRTFSYDFILYGSSFVDPLKQLVDQRIGKTLVYIPPVNSCPSLGAKGEDVNAVLRAIAGTDAPIIVDADKPVMQVKRGDQWIKVVDLVNETNRDKKVAAIVQAHNARGSDLVDVVIALGMFREGGNWRWANREIIIGHRGSLTEVVQMIGRLFRDVDGKSHVEAYQLLPFAFDQTNKEQTRQDLNQYLASILLSMLVENVITPVVVPSRGVRRDIGERPINYLREAFADEWEAVAALEDIRRQMLDVIGDMWEDTGDAKKSLYAVVSNVLSGRNVQEYHEEIAEQVYRMYARRTVTLTRLNVGKVGVGLIQENPFACLLQYTSDACGINTFRQLRTASRPGVFQPFPDARAYVRALGFTSVYQWYSYCASGMRPADIPSNPDHVYKHSGWAGYRDWLGTETVWRGFAEAREFVHSLQLKNQNDWYTYCKSGGKPDDIPSDPHQVYKAKGWCGLGDWLGTGTVAPRNMSFRPLTEAREFVRGLGLRSQREWKEYCKSGRRPSDIPTNPHVIYRDTGWAGLSDWLGTDTIPSCALKFRPFPEARLFVHTLGLRTQGEWFEYCKSGKKPRDIPASPNVVYKGSGWKGLRDWLGTEKRGRTKRAFRPFAEARQFVRTQGLRGLSDWLEFSRSEKRPRDIPSNPAVVYKKDGWTNLGDWLGNGKVGRGRTGAFLERESPEVICVDKIIATGVEGRYWPESQQ